MPAPRPKLGVRPSLLGRIAPPCAHSPRNPKLRLAERRCAVVTRRFHSFAAGMDNSRVQPGSTGEALVELILASSSPYRRKLLERLGVSFVQHDPSVDETPISGESAEALVERLAIAKARAAATLYPQSLIIASDQVCVLGDSILGKPGTHSRAVQQLEGASGREVLFLTGLCVLNASASTVQSAVVPYRVHFRALSHEQIETYLRRERPYDCTGSFRSEGLGVALVERQEGEDPNALVGLPLIRLVDMLTAEGLDVLRL